MKNETKKYYAWLGQTATTGTPHPVTSRMSYYGDDYVFQTKRERDEFVKNVRLDSSEQVFACTKRELRDKNLGASVADWEGSLKYRQFKYDFAEQTITKLL